MSTLRVVIADDDVLLREGLASLLQREGFEVAGQAGDASELLTLVEKEQPHLVLVDIRMPPNHDAEGLDAARTIRERSPDTAILVLSAHVDVDHAMELLAGGRSIGYLLKKFAFDPAPLVLGLVIAPIFELSLRQSLIMSGGSWQIFFQRPIALVLLAISAILLGLAAWGAIAARRDWRAKMAAAEAGE